MTKNSYHNSFTSFILHSMKNEQKKKRITTTGRLKKWSKILKSYPYLREKSQ